MNIPVIKALLARDLGMIRRSRALMLPMLFLPTLLLVVLPAAIGLSARERTLDVGTEVVIVRSGDVMTIYPARMTVAEMVARLAEMPRPGAIEARDQGEVSERAE